MEAGDRRDMRPGAEVSGEPEAGKGREADSPPAGGGTCLLMR